MKIRKMILFFLFIIKVFLSDKALAWEAVYHEIHSIDIHYDIYESISKNVFRIHNLNTLVASREDGLNILTYGRLSKNISDSFNTREKMYYFYDNIRPFDFKKDTTTLTFEIYQDNVKFYDIYFHSNSGKWYKRNFNCSFEGYQIPERILLSEWIKDDLIEKSIEIDRILIIIEPNNKNEKIEFVTSKFIISDEIKTEHICQHPFLDKLFDKIGNCDSLIMGNGLLFSNEDNPLLCTKDTYGMQLISNYFEFKNNQNELEVPFIKKIIRLIAEEYPFYKERNLDKRLILKKIDDFCLVNHDTLSVQAFTESLSLLINKEFKDAHFLLNPPNPSKEEKLVSAPIRLYEIESRILVAAILDSLYTDINLGTEILAIDNKPVEVLIDSLSMFQLGQPERQRMKAVSLLLHKTKNDSTVITYKRNNQFVNRTIYYNRKVNIPPNFKPTHCLYEFVDSVAYFKISQMDNQAFLRFFNHMEEIKKAKGIIIDLRGNPGGSSLVGENIFSLFIDKPTVYHYIGVANKTDKYESRLISPNKKIHFPSNYPVVIIGDENTACASEDFIQAMKQIKQFYFVSHSRTIGFLHNRYGISFPSSTFLSIDCLSEKIYSNNGNLVECNGVEPTVWIQPTSVNDLAPYNDLLKIAAKKIVTSKFW